MKLTDLHPKFLKVITPAEFEVTDDIHEAAGLQLDCPACHWAGRRIHDPNAHVHPVILLRPTPPLWDLTGKGYDDLTLAAGRYPVTLWSGCRATFEIKRCKQRFY